MPRYAVVPVVIAFVCLFTGCQGDQAEPVQRIDADLPSAPTSNAIIPIEQVAKSQAAAVAQRVASTEITVTYSRPVARGRDLFGALVPYDEVWNPGADQATAVSFSRSVEIDGHPLPSGTYSLWAIPGSDEWTVIFSRAWDVYHTPYPGEEHDALRLAIRPQHGTHMETLAFYFPVVDGKDAVLRLHWGTVIVPLAVRVS